MHTFFRDKFSAHFRHFARRTKEFKGFGLLLESDGKPDMVPGASLATKRRTSRRFRRRWPGGWVRGSGQKNRTNGP